MYGCNKIYMCTYWVNVSSHTIWVVYLNPRSYLLENIAYSDFYDILLFEHYVPVCKLYFKAASW